MLRPEFPRLVPEAPAAEAGVRADNVIPIPRAQLPDQTADVAIEDWGCLFEAVTHRLGHIAGEAALTDDDGVRRVRAGVAECVGALEQLHLTLSHELSRRQQLEREAQRARAALALVRAELAQARGQERGVRDLALHDRLTSLPNRSYFHARLEQALEVDAGRRAPLALLYLDLDDFGPINASEGREIGDELLRIVAVRLARAVRAEDLVSRLGKDEFACLLADLPEHDGLAHVARKLIAAVAAPLRIGTLTLELRCSIGIALCPGDGTRAESLLQHAGAAMARARRQRSGHAFFDAAADGSAIGWSRAVPSEDSRPC